MMGTDSALFLSAMLSRTPPPLGSISSAESSAFASAAGNSLSTPMTSPVDFISGPR